MYAWLFPDSLFLRNWIGSEVPPSHSWHGNEVADSAFRRKPSLSSIGSPLPISELAILGG
jgi:hypothetical protein